MAVDCLHLRRVKYLIPAVTIGLLAGSANAAFVQVWQAGIDNNSNSDFGTEGGVNAAPGSATLKDDDWYFAGTYPAPVGTLATDEPLTQFERALVVSDPTNRIHFNMPLSLIGSSYEYRLVIETVSNQSGVTSNPIPFTASFNGVEVFSGTVDELAEPFTSPVFLGSAVSPTTGDNVVELTRSTTTGAGWMQFDIVRLEVQVPEPASATGVALLAGGLLARRRRAAR